MCSERGRSLVAPEEEFLADLGILLVRIDLGVGFFELRHKLLAAAHDFCHSVPVVAIDGKAFLIYFRGKTLSTHQSTEVAQWCCSLGTKEPSQFLAQKVVKFSDFISSVCLKMLGHLLDPPLLFQLQPRSCRNIVANVANDLLVGLGAMLQLIERILKLVHQFPGKLWSSFRQARGFQI